MARKKVGKTKKFAGGGYTGSWQDDEKDRWLPQTSDILREARDIYHNPSKYGAGAASPGMYSAGLAARTATAAIPALVVDSYNAFDNTIGKHVGGFFSGLLGDNATPQPEKPVAPAIPTSNVTPRPEKSVAPAIPASSATGNTDKSDTASGTSQSKPTAALPQIPSLYTGVPSYYNRLPQALPISESAKPSTPFASSVAAALRNKNVGGNEGPIVSMIGKPDSAFNPEYLQKQLDSLRWKFEDALFRAGSSSAKARLMQAYAQAAQALLNPYAQMYNADKSAQSHMYGADQSSRANMYGADQTLSGMLLNSEGALERAKMDADARRAQFATDLQRQLLQNEGQLQNTDLGKRYELMKEQLSSQSPLSLAHAKYYGAMADSAKTQPATPFDASINVLTSLAAKGTPLTKEQEAQLQDLGNRRYEFLRRLAARKEENPGYANGGAVSSAFDIAAPSGAMVPTMPYGNMEMGDPKLMAQYGQYLSMAKQLGLPPLSFQAFRQSREAAMNRARAAMQMPMPGEQAFADGGAIDRRNWFERLTNTAKYKNDPSYIAEQEAKKQTQLQQQQQNAPQEKQAPGSLRELIEQRNRYISNLADGGAIPVAGRQVIDPYHNGETDTIPAIIDGSQKAALNSGEVVIPADVVKKLGTEYFDKLINKYHHSTKPFPPQ